jgi:chromosome segregation ATPase
MMTSEDITRVKRGPADLEERIDQLEKQKEILKAACKKAGARIEELERDRKILIQDIDRLSEDKNNLETIIRQK